MSSMKLTIATRRPLGVSLQSRVLIAGAADVNSELLERLAHDPATAMAAERRCVP